MCCTSYRDIQPDAGHKNIIFYVYRYKCESPCDEHRRRPFMHHRVRKSLEDNGTWAEGKGNFHEYFSFPIYATIEGEEQGRRTKKNFVACATQPTTNKKARQTQTLSDKKSHQQQQHFIAGRERRAKNPRSFYVFGSRICK